MFSSKSSVVNAVLKSIKGYNKVQTANIYNRSKIGNREWVCFGRNGTAYYDDDPSVPFPAVRFKEITNELMALKEKEKGDWRKLTIEEKKILYRASFRQTFAEFLAPTGEWKSIVGFTFFFVSLGLWAFYLIRWVANVEKPITFNDDRRRAQFRRMLEMQVGHINGLSSKWDYELDDWKK